MPLVSLSCSIIENLKVYAMTDVSPRTDISTDVDTDDKHQRVMSFIFDWYALLYISFHVHDSYYYALGRG